MLRFVNDSIEAIDSGYGLFAVVAVGFAIGFVSIFNDVAKRAEVDKETAQLTAAKSHRDQLYDELISLVYFEMFDEKPLSRKYEIYLLDLINSVSRFPDADYQNFIIIVKKIRQSCLMSQKPLFESLITDVNLEFPNNAYAYLLEKLQGDRLKDLDTLTIPLRYLTYNITSLPFRNYKQFLTLLDELRELEKKLPKSVEGE